MSCKSVRFMSNRCAKLFLAYISVIPCGVVCHFVMRECKNLPFIKVSAI